jgi:hypothetical protein
MLRTRVLGLALVAVFALSAIAASAAMAEKFHAEKAPVKLTGTQLEAHVFKAQAGTISCSKASFSGESLSTAVAELNITAAYSECTFLGVVGVPVEMGGCSYQFLEPSAKKGKVSVVGTECTLTAKPIKFTAAGCTVKIAKQANLGTIEYVNKGTGSGRQVEVIPDVTGITYTQSGCLTNGEFHEGEYHPGKTLVKGGFKNELGEVEADGIWVE